MCVAHLERCSSLVATTRGVLLLKQMVEKRTKNEPTVNMLPRS